MPTVGLPEPEFIAREVRRLAMRYVEHSMPRRRTHVDPQDPRALVERSAIILELLVFAFGVVEAAQELGVRGVSATPERMRKLHATALTLSGLSAEAVREVMRHIEVREGPVVQGELERSFEEFGAQLPEMGATVLKLCPVAQLVATAQGLGLLEHAHRIQRAHTHLSAITRRNKHPQDHLLNVVGRAYSEGRLSVQEVADILRGDTADAIAQLESHGFNRPSEQIALSEAHRTQLLGKARAERRSRAGQPIVDVDLVRREVVASQRIEGIDARSWFTSHRS